MTVAERIFAHGTYSLVPVPNDATWTRSGSNPVFSGNPGEWDVAVDNPSVRYSGGSFQGWFAGTNSPSANAAMGYMTSSDGLSWTRHLTGGSDIPVLGRGHGGIGPSGEDHTIYQPNVYLLDGTLHAYFNDPNSSNGLSVAASSDGISWTTISRNILSFATGVDQWNSAAVIKLGATFHMLVEGHHGSIYETYYATSASPTSGWSLGNGGGPVTDLQIAAGGMYGGPNISVLSDGFVHCYYHAAPGTGNLPTNLYAATADPSDLTTWTPSATSPILTHTGSGNETEQIADPCLVLVGREWRLYFAGISSESPFASVVLMANQTV